MNTQTEISTLLVRAPQGGLRVLVAYTEPRALNAPHEAELLRWARDVEGHWYSFSRYADAVIESSSGIWYEIVSGASNEILPDASCDVAA